MAAAAATADLPSDLNLAEGANEEEDNGGGAEGGANNDGNLKPPALPEGGVSANVAATVSMPHPQLQQLQQFAAMQQMNRATAASLPQPPAPPTMNHGGDDSGFAAGFMAATAYHNRQVQSMLGSALMSGMPLDSFPNAQATLPSSPSSMSRLQGLQGGNNFAAMMGAAAAAHRQSSSELAMTQQMQQMQASVAAASRPNVQNDFAMAQQLQLQAYQNFLNGRNAMPPPR